MKLTNLLEKKHNKPYNENDLENINVLIAHLETNDKDEDFDIEDMLKTVKKIKQHISEELEFGI